jgi:hypothetical protein
MARDILFQIDSGPGDDENSEKTRSEDICGTSDISGLPEEVRMLNALTEYIVHVYKFKDDQFSSGASNITYKEALGIMEILLREHADSLKGIDIACALPFVRKHVVFRVSRMHNV